MGLFVATPMFGGQCYGSYTHSIMRLGMLAAERKIDLKYFILFNESHIDRGRNICVDDFLRSSMNHMLFVDSDIQFRAEDALELMKWADPESDKDIICGFYPKKCINWKKIVIAVKRGFADEDPNVLERFIGDMVFTPALNDEMYKSKSIYEPIEIHEGGTGFMMIQRKVFERIREKYPYLTYFKNLETMEPITCFFDAKIDPEENPFKRFLSEDFDFCRLVRSVGMKIWLAPWMKLTHHGYAKFIGDLEALAACEIKRGEA